MCGLNVTETWYSKPTSTADRTVGAGLVPLFSCELDTGNVVAKVLRSLTCSCVVATTITASSAPSAAGPGPPKGGLDFVVASWDPRYPPGLEGGHFAQGCMYLVWNWEVQRLILALSPKGPITSTMKTLCFCRGSY